MIHHKSFPRAAVVGNPSDGYNGKTIAFVFSNFEANVYLEASDQLEISSDHAPSISFKNTEELDKYIDSNGYDDPKLQSHKLVAASIRCYYNNHDITESKINSTFKITYNSTIPISVGLAGSSAIITATLRSILEFNNLSIDKIALANQILAVEKEELNIEAGLQDRIAQAYEQPMFMDFDKLIMDKKGHGEYNPIDGLEHIQFYLAYPTNLSESSNQVHSDLRERFDSGDLQLKLAMEAFGGLTNSFKEALKNKMIEELNTIINRNYDLRKSIMKINPAFDLMIRLARNIGVSAKFTGSGGAFIGIYKDDAQLNELKEIMSQHDIVVLRPSIVSKNEN